MKKFTNVNILNEKKKKRKNVVISLIPILLGLICMLFINKVEKGSTLETLLLAGCVILLIVGIVFLIATLVNLASYPKGYRKLDESKIKELDDEMNDKKALYYEEMKLYLTKNYVIDFIGELQVVNYEDILWMYRFEQRSNGDKMSEGIKLTGNDGKVYAVANTVATSESKDDVYSEIWKKIANRNNTMLLGYTNENIEVMKEKMEEIKKKSK